MELQSQVVSLKDLLQRICPASFEASTAMQRTGKVALGADMYLLFRVLAVVPMRLAPFF